MPDVIVIGGGHNGLVAAAYLAMTGLQVTVLERRAQVGGAAVTEEFHPGFRNSVAAYTVSLLNPKIIRDLEPTAMGCASRSAPYRTFCPCPMAAISRSRRGAPKRRSPNSLVGTPSGSAPTRRALRA